ncbi:MAG TPA: ATP-binding protein [Candidatus Eisenbacteria bacterium]|nr:ATP-binding protein [Candidatus Eisenbacteria bacterium]
MTRSSPVVGRPGRLLAGIRPRLSGVVAGCVLVTGFAFYVTFLSFAHQWLFGELDDRGRSLARFLAHRTETTVLLGDALELTREAGRTTLEADVVAVQFLRPNGTVLAQRIKDNLIWKSAPPVIDPRAAGMPERLVVPAEEGVQLRIYAAPVTRDVPRSDPHEVEARELYGWNAEGETDEEHTEPVGWVRVAVSTVRLERQVETVGRLGLVVLLIVLALGITAALFLVGFVVRPLREASGLAEEIAAGQLDRRIPVRASDELGALAESMNLMASRLSEARRRAQEEAGALRRAVAAVVAIAQGARRSQGLATVFGTVAAELRVITECDGVALAVPEDEGRLAFRHFDPVEAWNGLPPGSTLGAGVLDGLPADGTTPLRLSLDAATEPFTWGLVAMGARSALVVPLALAEGSRGALLLVSPRPAAFPPSEVDVVRALAGHLAAALEAEQLRQRLQSASEELERTRDQLVRSERLRMAGELASGVAHEFNNVLGAILGRAQLLRRQSQEGRLTPAALESALDVVEVVAQDGADTVRRLREFSIGGDPVAFEIVDVDRLARDAVEFARPRWENEMQAEGKAVRVKVESEPGAWVEGRSSELREVFMNLLLNAVDALPKGGQIVVRARATGEEVTVSVEDDGIGMDEATKSRVFDPFFTTKGDKGTGLGLTMVYGIVGRHRGRTTIESVPGHGTRITMVFPRASAPPPLALAPDSPSAPLAEPDHTLSVLAVDDEPAVLDLLADIVETLGHRVTRHSSAERALADVQPGRYDLVLTDLGMPGMSGWEFSRALRAVDAHVPLAWITGWGEEIVGDASRRDGADAIVAKPFTIEDIKRLLAMAAAKRQQNKAA